MSRAYFVSDIHISAPDDQRAITFGRFLDHCVVDPPSHLVLVGDIFDLWIADRAYFVARYAGIIDRVRAIRAAGTAVHYFEGNHDLDLARFWTRDLGVVTHDGPALIDVAGARVWVEHGDQMDPADRGYHVLRWLLRTPIMKWLGRYLPNAGVAWIGERMSRVSRRYTSEVRATNDAAAKDLLAAHVVRVRAREAFDVFVSGHVHVAWEARIGGVRAFNLGTWLKDPLVLTIHDGETDLGPPPLI